MSCMYVQAMQASCETYTYFVFRVNSRLRFEEPNFRQKEKEILDRVLGMDRYDSRIRPAGMQNDTSKCIFTSQTFLHVSTFYK